MAQAVRTVQTLMNHAEWVSLLRSEPLPAAVVDLSALDQNIRSVAQMVRGKIPPKTLRLATKSIRVPALIQRVLKFGPPYQGLMCYSAHEARLLSTFGLDDFLVAYPSTRDSDLEALKDLHQQGQKIRIVVDSTTHLGALAAKMKGVSIPFSVIVEIDLSWRPLGGHMHFGVRRSPIRTEADVFQILEEIGKRPELRFSGIMAYEAQVAGVGDRNPFKKLLSPVIYWMRRHSARLVSERRRNLSKQLVDRKIQMEVFNGAGTGSLSFAADEDALTELTAGSAFFCPHLFDYYSNLSLQPSAFFALAVVRASDPGFVTCQGGGYIASGEPGWDRVPIPHLPSKLKLVSMEGAGEVQTPLRIPTGLNLRVGDPVLFRHAKAGELMERFNQVLLVSNGKIVDRVPTYRGLGQSFF